jgi:CubicO group peptidase (beta-lactamase class C family)
MNRHALLLRPSIVGPFLVALLVMPHTELNAQAVALAPAATSPGGPTDPAELEAFMDGLMTAHLTEKGIAGATVAVVGHDELLLLKGYGFADVAARTPVDPERTLFRIASVTKLFTATALMQLVQDGRLDLEADVNRYLDFEIPATFPDSITVRHLLTHTPGFEDDMRLLLSYDPADVLPLRDLLISTMPRRVRPPGAFAAYSNYGMTLGGYIVERVSGLSWEDYLERHIFEPLGMTRTTGRQPLPASVAGDMSESYLRARGGWERQRWEFDLGAPAGAISSTARDMGRFMLAHLGGGALSGARILDEETIRTMHARHFAHDPRIAGMALGFFEMSSHGVRIVGHGGNTAWFHNVLALIPERQLGIFVSYNTDTGATLSYGPFLTAFLDHYVPDVPAPPEAPTDFAARVRGLTGAYRFNRMSYSTFQKAFGLVTTSSFRAADGALLARTPLGEMRLIEEEPLLFREEVGHGRVAFRTDDTGRATHAFLSLTPMMALERVPWHGLPALHFAVLGGGAVVFLGILLTGGVRSIRRWRGIRGRTERSVVLGRRAVVVTAAAHLGFVAALAMLAVTVDMWEFFAGPMTGLKVALAFPVVAVVATLGAAAALGAAFRRGEGSRWARFRLAGAVLVAMLFAWSLNYWNLLGWRL